MALHDYRCLCCGHLLQDQYRSVAEGALARLPECPFCHAEMQWIPQVGRMDALEPFQEFSVLDGRNEPVVIDSLRKLRQVERDSEAMARNGEGQQMVFRAYSQNHKLDHTFGEIPQEKPSLEGKRKFGLRSGTKALSGEPEVSFGPGVNESNTSALKDQ